MNPAISDRGSSITTKCLEDLGILQQDNWNGQLNRDFVFEYGSEDGVTDADKEIFALETLAMLFRGSLHEDKLNSTIAW